MLAGASTGRGAVVAALRFTLTESWSVDITRAGFLLLPVSRLLTLQSVLSRWKSRPEMLFWHIGMQVDLEPKPVCLLSTGDNQSVAQPFL